MSHKDHQASPGKGEAQEILTIEGLSAKLAIAEAVGASKAEEIAHLRELILQLMSNASDAAQRYEDVVQNRTQPTRLFGSWTNGLACIGLVAVIGLLFSKN